MKLFYLSAKKFRIFILTTVISFLFLLGINTILIAFASPLDINAVITVFE